jgi:hypothetical protein
VTYVSRGSFEDEEAEGAPVRTATGPKARATQGPRWANNQAEAASADAPKWWDVIDVATEEGVAESAVFVVLMKSVGVPWMAADEIARRAGLPLDEVREILARHVATGLIASHPSRPDVWADGAAIAHLAALRSRRSRERGALAASRDSRTAIRWR